MILSVTSTSRSGLETHSIMQSSAQHLHKLATLIDLYYFYSGKKKIIENWNNLLRLSAHRHAEKGIHFYSS